MARIKYTPLYLEAKTELIKMIKKGDFKDNRLPPEEELSERLGISRSTIREALITLDREGIITKKQGIGSLIHKSTLTTKMRIDLVQDFIKLLENGGYKASVKRINSTWLDEIPQVEIKMPPLKDKKYFLNEFLYLADYQPAILATNIIPESSLAIPLQTKEIPFNSFKGFFDFLSKYTNEEVSHSITRFIPSKVDTKISRILEIKENEPIIKREEFYYGIFDKLICCSEIVFHPGLVDLTIVRKLD
ncbi:MAG TPA: GntR family transcriptional regulator [Candidatus Atribacteria bacterium]|uniref:Transcriptional regulator, GntR family n=1 Tax=candidate division TA06 bacterium 34_109 TaxID=1635277 RepID=A0A117M638_UNCT6|nr:MAG: Transcriptional regulator, GntR family [candidate division TA06 bacterium 34_109]HBY57230.1 GntR family transcriptional regulator [Candidatus Atribacteria bacterium]